MRNALPTLSQQNLHFCHEGWPYDVSWWLRTSGGKPKKLRLFFHVISKSPTVLPASRSRAAVSKPCQGFLWIKERMKWCFGGIDHDPLLLQSLGIHGLQVEALEAFRPLSCHKENFNWLPCKQLLKPQAYPDLSVLKQYKKHSWINGKCCDITWRLAPSKRPWGAQRFASSTNEGPFKNFQGYGWLWIVWQEVNEGRRVAHLQRKKGTSAPARSEPRGWEGFNDTSVKVTVDWADFVRLLRLWHIFFEARIQESCRHQFVHR